MIKNFILIEQANLDFEQGFNVLCGETGAGKSIIIKAIDCVLGAKISKEMILDKSSPCLIEAVFEKEGVETVISRETLSTSKYRLNGLLSSQDEIKALRENLLDIHSQHQTYSYILPKTHIHLLDSYIIKCCPEYSELLDTYKENFKQYTDISRKLENLKQNLEENEREIEFLSFQLKELDDAEVLENEEEELKQEIDVLSNIQNLKETSNSCYWALGGDDDNIIEALGKIKYELSSLSEIDKSLEEVKNSLFDAFETLKDSASFLQNYSSSLELNPQRLDELNERISLIQKLKRKYGQDLDFERQKIASRLEELTSSENNVEELEKKYNELQETIEFLCFKLQSYRQEHSLELSKQIEDKLKSLEIKEAQFLISVKQTKIGEFGFDDVEFLISANKNQNPMPLNKVASGGEISRVMLAMKTIFASIDKISTVIFDEIDTGISGIASQSVANSMLELAKSTQIICITHQAIIAAKADNFIWISKTHDDKTSIKIEILNSNSRLNALAQLAGGEVSDKSLEFAKTLI